jgi:3-dehydroquinate synthase
MNNDSPLKMKTINIQTDSGISRILIGEKLQNLPKYLPGGKTIIITDDNILKYYHSVLPDFPVITIGKGEKNKTLETVQFIFDQLLELEADRFTYIVGIGGGIVCDVCGFAASLYMRGLRFGFVSTTLLSQVDASVGGKNGVNFRGYKNMIGVFNQPDFVLCDTDMLETLEDREFRAGFSEIIKAAAIHNAPLFTYLEDHPREALQKKTEVIEKLIFDSVKIKSWVVEQDEREKGERKKLNFGHTFAHSIEHLTGMLHGEAVSIGMVLASALSVQQGLLPAGDAGRIRELLIQFGLPVDLGPDLKELVQSMKKDKKREGEYLHMVLLKSIGTAVIQKMSIDELEKIKL